MVGGDVILWAKGIDATDPPTALHHFEQVTHPMTRNMSALDRVEAAARAGRPTTDRGVGQRARSTADQTQMPWGAAAAAHAQALLATETEAVSLFERALDAHTRLLETAGPSPHQLAFGEHLRRSRRRIDAREHLKAALETFEDLGATRWAERARQELRASGETARRREPSTTADLTAQERHVATLVRQGLNNRDVAAQLFVSPRTVDFHLRNVFAKLGPLLASRTRSARARLIQVIRPRDCLPASAGKISVRSCRSPVSGSQPAQTSTRQAPLGSWSTAPRERERRDDGGMLQRFRVMKRTQDHAIMPSPQFNAVGRVGLEPTTDGS